MLNQKGFKEYLETRNIKDAIEAEMETKLGYSKNERTDNENYRNGYYPERTVSTEMGDIPVKVPRDRNGEINSDLVPKYSRTVNGFDEILKSY